MSKSIIKTELRADSAQMRAEFSKAQKKVNSYSKSMKAAAKAAVGVTAGVVGVRAGAAIFGELLDKFDRLDKISNRFNMPVEDVQRLSVAAELTGSSLEKLTSALTKATVSGSEAANGLATYKDAFADLNIDVDEFNQASPDKKLALIARSFNEAKDETTAFSAAYKILGKSGADLIPLLRASADGIAELTKNIKVLSQDEIDAITKYNDSMTKLKSNLQAGIGKAFAEDIDAIQKSVTDAGEMLVIGITKVIEYRKAIASVVAVAVAFNAIKWSVGMAKFGVEIGVTAVKLAGLTTATAAETVAVNANTKAQLANAAARSKIGKGGGDLVGGSGRVGKVAGVVGKVAKVGAKAVGVGVAAKIGWEVGSAIEKGLGVSDYVVKQLTGKTQELVVRLNKASSGTAEILGKAKSLKDVELARIEIRGEISKLEHLSSTYLTGEKKKMAEVTIQMLKNRDANAENVFLKRQELAAQDQLNGAVKAQAGSYDYLLSKSREIAESRKIVAKEEFESARKLAAEVRGLTEGAVGRELELLPSADKVRIFGNTLRKQLAEAAGVINFGKLDKASVNTPEDVFRAAQGAASAGDLERSKYLLGLVESMQTTQARLTSAKQEQASLDEAALQIAQQQTEEAKAMRDAVADKVKSHNLSREALSQELTLLKLKADGRNEAAAALEKELGIRSEALRIAESTGLAEQESLRLARQKAELLERGGAAAGDKATLGRGVPLADAAGVRLNGGRQLQIGQVARGGSGGISEKAVRELADRSSKGIKKDPALDKFDKVIENGDQLLEQWKKIAS